MKKTLLKKADVISILLCLLAIVPGILVYSKLPDKVPTNFGIKGEPSEYASKPFAVFLIPCIVALLQLVLCLITNMVWKEKRTGRGEVVIRMLVPVIAILAQGSILLYSLGRLQNIMSVIGLIITFMYFVVGNYFPKIRRNAIYGIRTPHTLADPVVWDKTHRFAGPIWVVSSVLFLIITIMDLAPVLYLVIALASLIIPIIYSEIVYRKQSSK